MKAVFLTAGDCAMSVQLGDEISLEVNTRVRMLAHALEEHPIAGVREMVPTYTTLTIHYHPDVIRAEELKAQVSHRLSSMEQLEETKQFVKEIPICYGGELGPDLELCAKLEHTSTDEIIRMHASHLYYSYMLGFAPGHAYMARFEEPYHFKRRDTPRVHIEAGAVVVQQNLSNLIPFEQPCGWNIIGSTPLKVCDYSRKDPFLVHAGDWVKFIPVSLKEFQQIKALDQKGAYHVKTYERTVK